MIIQVEANQCDVCGHVWLAPKPTRCAKCKSRQWNVANTAHKEASPTTRVEATTHTVHKPVEALVVPLVPVIDSRVVLEVPAAVPTVPEASTNDPFESVFDEPVRVVHDPLECQDRACRDCRKLRRKG